MLKNIRQVDEQVNNPVRNIYSLPVMKLDVEIAVVLNLTAL